MSSVIRFAVMGMSLLIFVAAETVAIEQLPSKMTSASAAIPGFGQCLPSRCLANGHIASQYFCMSTESRNILIRMESIYSMTAQ
jgi:hypothetical protein